MATREQMLAEIKRRRLIDQIKAKRDQVKPVKQESPHDDFDFDVVQMAKNVPASAGRLVSGLASAVANPLDTGKAVGNLARSTGNYLGRKAAELVTGQEIAPDPMNDESIAQATGQAIKDRYGSVNALKRTLQNDPVGALADASGAGMAVGALPKLSRVAQISAAADPINLMAKATRASAKQVLPKALAPRIYESALKIKKNTLEGQDAAVAAAMEEGVMPTRKGFEKLESDIAGSQGKADAMINDATNQGAQVYSEDAFTYVPKVREKMGGKKLEAKKNLKTIDKIEAELKETFGKEWGMTPKEMQELKTDAYKKIYKPDGTRKREAKADTYTAIARGAKESLEQAIPGLKEVNERTGKLLDIRRPLEMSIMNAQKSRLSPAVSLGGAGVAAGLVSLFGPVSAGAGVLTLAILSRPASKAKIAIALNKLKKGDVNWAGNDLSRAEARVTLYLAEREKQMQEQEKE